MSETEILPGYNKLTDQEKNLLLEAPVAFSILAALADDDRVEPNEQEEAERIAKVKSYHEIPALQPFYQEVEKGFKEKFKRLIGELSGSDEQKKSFIKAKIEQLKPIISKLPKEHAKKLVKSFKDFVKYVSKSNSSFLEFFLLPLIINELEKSVRPNE